MMKSKIVLIIGILFILVLASEVFSLNHYYTGGDYGYLSGGRLNNPNYYSSSSSYNTPPGYYGSVDPYYGGRVSDSRYYNTPQDNYNQNSRLNPNYIPSSSSYYGSSPSYGSSYGFYDRGSSTFSGGLYSGFTSGSNYVQYRTPSFEKFYSGGDLGLGDIYPIIERMNTEQCEARQDFIIGIPPGGCSPAVVRSDLIAEQKVPVFCQLYSIKINPLIDVSSIKTISFKGDYPEGVSAVSFHPARAAVRSYRTLLGDPVANNIGYVVIILDQERVEDNLPEWIAGNLTAILRYDAEEAYGTGRSEHYLSLNIDDEAGVDYSESTFWNGRGGLEFILGMKKSLKLFCSKVKLVILITFLDFIAEQELNLN